ncbi:MAG: 4Fe-4S dicluster domain-containing protein [Syntrophobacteraceae bacterium]
MTQQVYRDVLEVMKKRGGPYAGSDIPEFYAMVEEFFTPEEAEINNVLVRKPATYQEIAQRAQKNENEVKEILERMADKGLCGVPIVSGVRLYQGLPFMPGLFEFHFIGGRETERERRIAELIGAYRKAHDAAEGFEKITYPVTRVIPVARTIRADNVIHTYDQVVTYIEKHDCISIGACLCRQSAKLRGEDIHGMPTEACMWFGKMAEHIVERFGVRRVTKQEAKDILDRLEEAGLLHLSRNTTEDIDYMCNCDRWHCEVVTNVLKQPKPGLVFNSGFQPVFDAERCVSCEICIGRCPPEALTMGEDDVPKINADRCFGCAVCASGCPEEAIAMVAKPGFPIPPKDVKELAAALKSSAKSDKG